MVFDPLGEYTAQLFLLKKQGAGYDVLDRQKLRFDEKNNLDSAIKVFCDLIRTGQPGNLPLSLKVTGLAEEINRKIGDRRAGC